MNAEENGGKKTLRKDGEKKMLSTNWCVRSATRSLKATERANENTVVTSAI